jgi:hypothetical protein
MGFHKLLIRLEDADTGQPVNVITRYFEVRPGLEITMTPFSLYAKRMNAVVNIFHPDAVKPGARLSVSLFRDKENRPLVTIKRESPQLDAAGRNDMRAFVYVSNPYNVRRGKWQIEEIEQDLAARLNQPALLGRYLVDEPEGIGETNQDTLRRLYETVKAKDMNHPCSLVIMSPHAASVYGFHSDIVWVDPYPVPDFPVTFVSERIDGVIKAVKGERPVWAVLQAFDWNKWRKGAIDRVHRPTPGEERCMTYLALVHGAKGIIFWTHTASRYYIRDYP